MKHILLLHQAFASVRQAGGSRHYEFARLLVPDGQYRFTIIASTLSYLTGRQTDANDDSSLEPGIDVIRVQSLAVAHRSFVWRVFTFISFMILSAWASRRAKNVDIVMGTTPPIFQAVSAWFVATIRRKPFLLEVRDLWPEFAIDMGVLTNPLLIRISRQLEAFLYHHADHILVNSPGYVNYMLNRGIPEDKVSLIPNGVDPDMFDPNADGHQIRRQWGLEDQFVVTYAGALGKANDVDTILRAALLLQDYPDIHFLLVGDGKERAHLEQQSKNRGLSNVTFTGVIPKSEMPTVMAASNVCAATLMDIPMFRTTYPNKVFDYMAAGKATILGIDGVIREVVEQANGGIFVPPGDEKAFADAVKQLYNDRARLAEMGESARAYVQAHFNRKHQAADFAALIDQLVEKS